MSGFDCSCSSSFPQFSDLGDTRSEGGDVKKFRLRAGKDEATEEPYLRLVGAGEGEAV